MPQIPLKTRTSSLSDSLTKAEMLERKSVCSCRSVSPLLVCVKTDERNEDGKVLFRVLRAEAGFVSNTLAWTFGKTLNGHVRV